MARIQVDLVAPGTYWVVDPQFVLPEAYRDKVIRAAQDGQTVFNIDGHRVPMFYIGDRGDFYDQEAKRYVVDSGVLAAIPVELVTNASKLSDRANTMSCTERFDCWYETPNIKFGPVHINLR